MAEPNDVNWARVIAKSLAMLSLDAARLRESGLADQGRYLVALGLPREDVAAMLGTSPNSLRVLLQKVAKRKGRRSASKRKVKG